MYYQYQYLLFQNSNLDIVLLKYYLFYINNNKILLYYLLIFYDIYILHVNE